MKQCISNEQTVKAIEAGARLMLVKIGLDSAMAKHISSSETLHEDNLKSFIPIQRGDEIYIAEEFGIRTNYDLRKNSKTYGQERKEIITHDSILFVAFKNQNKLESASEMTEQQSRFKFKVGGVSVKRVQDTLECDDLMDSLLPNNWQYVPCYSIDDDYSFNENEEIQQKREKVFIDWLKDQGIDYGANQYVALVELKEIAS